jgi:quinoprotein glucose dehydrogenase
MNRPIRRVRHAVSLRTGIVLTMALAAGGVATVVRSQAVGTVPTDGVQLADGPGRDQFAASCSGCHALSTVVNQPRNPDEWRDTIRKMIEYGAQIGDAEFATIHGYLSAHYTPANAPGKTAAATPAAPATLASSATPAGSAPVARYPRPSGPDQWRSYGGGPENANYSPLTQITPANVGNLKPAWVYHFGAGQANIGDEGLDYRFEVTPLLIGGVMYVSTPAPPRAPNLKASVTALKPETGEVLWKYESPLNIHGRGLAYWPGDEKTAPRLYFGTDQGYLMAVDITTGKLAPGFGRGGQIDAYIGVSSEIVGESRRHTYTIPNPATVYKNLIITGSRPGEAGPPGPRGDVRAWDARTGRLVWTFHTVPQPGEDNAETYDADEWREVTGANVWSTMTLDEKNGIVYAPVGDLNSDARGSQLYSSSILALDAATGKRIWHRQIVHRDIYDFDAPTPPVLTDYKGPDGKTVPALLLAGKQGLFFIFNRLTGEPLNGFTERPTPNIGANQKDLVWPTQPFPDAPGPLARTQMTRDEIPDLAPGMKAACTKFWDDNNTVSVPLYAPRQSSEHGTVSYPSSTGGPNWGGGAYNPQLGMYFVNTQNRAVFRAQSKDGSVGGMNRAAAPPAAGAAPAPRRRGQQPFTFALKEGVYLSCGATPWGELVAVDVAKKKIAWRVPLGVNDALGDKGLNAGAPNLGGSITTRSGLIFIGATNDRRFRAFDGKSGRKLWETKLEASAHATPITYMGADGKQYVAVAAAGGTSAGGPEMSDTLVAYALPSK